MTNKYTVFNDAIKYIVVVIVIILILIYTVREKSLFVFVGTISFMVWAILIRLNHYKIVINKDKIICYTLFNGNKTFRLSSIKRITIEEEKVVSKIQGERKFMHIFLDEGDYVFDIYNFNINLLCNDIKKIAQLHNIKIDIK